MELSQHVRASVSFIEAADTGSFAFAARSLGMSTAALRNLRPVGIAIMSLSMVSLSRTPASKRSATMSRKL